MHEKDNIESRLVGGIVPSKDDPLLEEILDDNEHLVGSIRARVLGADGSKVYFLIDKSGSTLGSTADRGHLVQRLIPQLLRVTVKSRIENNDENSESNAQTDPSEFPKVNLKKTSDPEGKPENDDSGNAVETKEPEIEESEVEEPADQDSISGEDTQATNVEIDNLENAHQDPSGFTQVIYFNIQLICLIGSFGIIFHLLKYGGSWVPKDYALASFLGSVIFFCFSFMKYKRKNLFPGYEVWYAINIITTSVATGKILEKVDISLWPGVHQVNYTSAALLCINILITIFLFGKFFEKRRT